MKIDYDSLPEDVAVDVCAAVLSVRTDGQPLSLDECLDIARGDEKLASSLYHDLARLASEGERIEFNVKPAHLSSDS